MLLRSRYETAAMTNVQKMTTHRKFPTGTIVVLGSCFKWLIAATLSPLRIVGLYVRYIFALEQA